MLYRLLLAALLALGLSSHAEAQQARIVSSCSAQNDRANEGGALTRLTNGDLCVVTAAGGGSGATTVTGSQEQDVRSSGTLDASTVNAAITIPVNGQSSVGLRFSGLAASGATVTFEQSNDGGTTYTGVNEVNAGTGVPSGTRTTDGQTRIAVQGRTNLRIRVTTAGTGSVSIAWTVSVREGLFTLASPLPPGTNTVGSIANTAFGISGPIPAGTNVIGTVNLGTLNGAATSAAQDTGNASLSSIQTSNSAINTAIGSTTDAATTSGSATSLVGALRSIRDRLANGVLASVTNIAGGVALIARLPSSTASTNLTQAKSGIGRLYKVVACNTTTTAARIKFYNALAANVTVGTTAPFLTRPIPAAAAAGGLNCVSYDMADVGWSFSTGISYALVTGAADADATAVAAGAITDVSVEYQ